MTISAVNIGTNKTVMKPVAAGLCLVRPGVGRITMQSSAEYLDQLRVRIYRTDISEPIPTKASVAASEAIHEIAWESARQFV
jgi:hypothetical protein